MTIAFALEGRRYKRQEGGSRLERPCFSFSSEFSSGPAFGAVVRMLLGMLTLHCRVPEFKFQLYFPASFLAQVFGSLLPIWETHIEF